MADVAELFFSAHVGGAEGAHKQLIERLEHCSDLPADTDLPPACEMLASSLNALGEAELDRATAAGFPFGAGGWAEARAAIGLFERSLAAMPHNCEAAMSLALIHRDSGELAQTSRCWRAVSASQPVRAAGEGACQVEWAEWLEGSRRRCVPLACLHLAIALSTQGDHSAATPLLRRFGFRIRLAPEVWAAAAAGPPPETSLPPPAAPLRLWADAVLPPLLRHLNAAFAPSAPYWRETGYHEASAQKRYFTFGVTDLAGLASGARRPAHAVEALVAALAPLCRGAGGGSGFGEERELVEAEWWVHSRPPAGHEGHQLHYDLEENTMETEGRVVHPAVSADGGEWEGGGEVLLNEEAVRCRGPTRTHFLRHSAQPCCLLPLPSSTKPLAFLVDHSPTVLGQHCRLFKLTLFPPPGIQVSSVIA
jgi:hypothetical protein